MIGALIRREWDALHRWVWVMLIRCAPGGLRWDRRRARIVWRPWWPATGPGDLAGSPKDEP